MKTIVGQAIDARRLPGHDVMRKASGYRLERCEVMGNMLPHRYVGEWQVIRECQAIDCMHYNGSLACTAIEDCLIDRMGQAGPLYFLLDCCVMKHVVLKGRVTTILCRFTPDRFELPTIGAKFSDGWREAMVGYYRDVDWALDITEAKFTAGPGLAIVPGDLVRYDPDRAICVRRAPLRGKGLADLPPLMQIYCEDFLLESPFDSFVIARGENKKARGAWPGIAAWMRENGFADSA